MSRSRTTTTGVGAAALVVTTLLSFGGGLPLAAADPAPPAAPPAPPAQVELGSADEHAPDHLDEVAVDPELTAELRDQGAIGPEDVAGQPSADVIWVQTEPKGDGTLAPDPAERTSDQPWTTSEAASVPQAIAGPGYNLSYSVGLRASYVLREVPGTYSGQALADTEQAAAQVTDLTGVGFTTGSQAPNATVGDGEVRVSVGELSDCAGTTGGGLAGCATVMFDANGVYGASIQYDPDIYNGTFGNVHLAVAVHEFGHAMGLSHFNDTFEGQKQVMYPTAYADVTSYRSGDRNGLWAMAEIEDPSTHDPYGELESTTPGPGTITATGWAIDPDTTAPVQVQLRLDGTLVETVTADENRPDVGDANPQAGPDHGFTATLTGVEPGDHQLCATALNLEIGTGSALLGCVTAAPDPTVPGVPRNIKVTPGDGELTISWDAPANDGGSPIVGYDARVVAASSGASSPAGASDPAVADPGCTTGGDGRSCTVAGLDNTQAYTARVFAFNEIGTGPESVSQPVSPDSADGLVAISPTRVVDTRTGTPLNGRSGVMSAFTSRTFQITGQAATLIPADATAVVANVTVTDTTGPGFLTLYPAGTPQPVASTLNWSPGETRANLTELGLGAGGKLTVYVNSPASVIIDIVGYFTEDGGQRYEPVSPSRILDSRNGSGAEGYTSPWPGFRTRSLRVTGRVGGVDVPTDATAVVLNVTAADPRGPGFLTAWPAGSDQPNASNLNWDGLRAATPNLVTVKVGANGRINLYTNNPTDLVADIVGWYVPDTEPGAGFRSTRPTRILDSRDGTGAEGYRTEWRTGTCRDVRVVGDLGTGANRIQVASGATAVVLNVTVSETLEPGYLTVFPSGSRVPDASNLNWVPGQTAPNLVIAAVGANGKVTMCSGVGRTDVIADVVGWYEPVG